MPAQLSMEQFRRRIEGRHRVHCRLQLGSHCAGQAVDQAEVGNLDMIADQEKVVRLDVEMLQIELMIQQVEHLGDLAQVIE